MPEELNGSAQNRGRKDKVGERARQDSLESASGGFGTLIDVAVNLLLDQTGIAITRLMETADVEFRPSEHACVSAHQMLVHLNDTGFSIPASDVYADPDRAIRILWSKDGRNAELVFPSSDVDKAYIYHSDEREYGVEESPSPGSALAWLTWVFRDFTPERFRAA